MAAVRLMHGPTTGYQNVLPIAGAALLLLSAAIYARRPVRAILAELTALLGAIAAGELAWLAPLVTAIYEAWLLDWQLSPLSLRERARGRAVEATDNQLETPSPPAPLPVGEGRLVATYWPYLYPLIATASAAVIGVKLVGRVLPYHFG
jgi:hypothetical protein